ncbi:MAG TPA: hypothetical protein PLR07_13730, partial [Promineifilum sp.]|nr:hypothetical protein [Promineifilum sp.]
LRITNWEGEGGKGEREKGGKGEGESTPSPLHPCSPSPLLDRMMALSVAYQEERPNVEVADLTALVIRALGLIVGRIVRDGLVVSVVSDVSDVNNGSEVYQKQHFLLSHTITAAAQALIEVHDLDINHEYVTTRKIGRVLGKMRLTKARQKGTGKNGWLVSLSEVVRRATSYGLNPTELTGINISPSNTNVTNITNITNHKAATPHEGIL